MSLSLNENQKKALVTLINQRFDEHISRFPYSKYPIEPLEHWRMQFADPKNIGPETLRSALTWRKGFWQRKDIPYAQRKIDITVIKAWAEFVEENSPIPARIFDFWTDKIANDNYGFDTAAYLLHLTRPDMIELADSHRLAAKQDLLKEIGHEESDQDITYTLSDLERYTDFFRTLLPKMQAKHKDKSRIQLDRFLKAYGNREVLAKVAGKIGSTIEPEFRIIEWDTLSCKHFAPNHISGRSNADTLFVCLLLSLEINPEFALTLTIADVVRLVPLGSGSICNPASYHYAMIAMFGGQKGRDFFLFDNEELQTAFTQQANASNRDMRFYRKHSDAKLSLHPKYIQS
ncbi:unnamed protein product [Aphanomyces euteiches]